MDVELSLEEMEVLKELILGLTNTAIAKKLYMSVGSVKLHLSVIFKKFNAKNRVDAAARGVLYFLQLENQQIEDQEKLKIAKRASLEALTQK